MHQETEQQDQQSEEVRPRRGYPANELRQALWRIFFAWVFGASFMAIISGATLTYFLTRYLQTDDVSYGLIMAAGPAAVLFFFLGSYVNERTGRIKRNFLIFVTLHRLLWLGIAAIPLFMHDLPSPIKVMLAGCFIFISAAAANFGGAGWIAWMAEIVPKRMAGAFFGNRASVGMISMVLTTVVIAWMLDHYPAERWLYAVVFSVAALIGAVDIIIFTGVREVPRPVQAKPPSMTEILVTPWKNVVFRSFACYTGVSWIAYMIMAPFAWRFCYEPVAKGGLGMSPSQANLALFIIPLLAMALVSPLWGRAIDRFGPKSVLVTSALGAIIFPIGWVVIHHQIVWLIYPLAVLSGLSWPGIEQTMAYMQVKGFPDARRTTYCASFQVVFGLSCVIGTTLGGVMASFSATHLGAFHWLPAWVSHYHPLFAISILLRVLAFFLLLLPMQMPGTASVRQVTRTLASDLVQKLPGLSQRARKKSREKKPEKIR